MRTFRDFMEAALYDPGLGFYQNRQARADFYTAPELHCAFAGVLADETARRLDALAAAGVPGPYWIVEIGAGEGRLAAALAARLKERRADLAATAIHAVVERAEAPLVKAALALGAEAHRALAFARLSDLPPLRGLLLSNELVDAFPVHLLEKRRGTIVELYVAEDGSLKPGSLSTPELSAFAAAAVRFLAEGERHAVNLEARRWLKAVAGKLEAGFLLTVDYGKRLRAEANPPRAYASHRIDADLTGDPGRKDLTASVDFEQLIQDGKREGFDLVEYTTLSRFLLERGIAAFIPTGDSVADMRSRSQIKTLLHPEGMGEAFKVLLQKKGIA